MAGYQEKDRDHQRLFLSGGGLRAMVGSMGVVLCLQHLGRWRAVREVVSVSGGSGVNAALLTAGGYTNDELSDVERMRWFYRRLLDDRAAPLRSVRRGLITAALVALVLGMAGLVVAAVMGVWFAGWASRAAALGTGLLLAPAAIQLGRRLATAFVRDVLERVTDSGGVRIADLSARPRLQRGSRTHVFCASGLVSRSPYFFYVGPLESIAQQHADGRNIWGYPIRAVGEQNDYSVGDAALASSSLPFIGDVRSPRRSGVGDGHLYDVVDREPLVDGGGNGIFGDQLRMPFATELHRVADEYRSTEAPTIMVDAFRHVRIPSARSWSAKARAFVRDRLSMIVSLVSWTKLATESLYVNDVLDATNDSSVMVLRLCETRNRFLPRTQVQLDADTEARIADLKRDLGQLGLFNLTPQRAVTGVTVGFVEAFVRITQSTDGLDDALREMGAFFLGDDDPHRDDFEKRWAATSPTIDLTIAKSTPLEMTS